MMATMMKIPTAAARKMPRHATDTKMRRKLRPVGGRAAAIPNPSPSTMGRRADPAAAPGRPGLVPLAARDLRLQILGNLYRLVLKARAGYGGFGVYVMLDLGDIYRTNIT